MYQEIKEILFNPYTFFNRVIQERPNLIFPSTIVGIGSIAGLVTPFIISAFPLGRTPTQVLLMGYTYLYLFLPFISWILIAGILYTIGRLFAGTGSFTTTLQNAGYGCLPLTFFSVIKIFDGIFNAQFIGISSPLFITATFVIGFFAVFFVVWSGWLWMVAMEKTHALSRNKAAVASTIIVLLYMSPVILNAIEIGYLTGAFPG
jgi:hypothetical protein